VLLPFYGKIRLIAFGRFIALIRLKKDNLKP
jgi:hypothetical protein